MKKYNTFCGHILIIGVTNAGKSSLLNRIMGKKISITSNKQGTTIQNIFGIQTIYPYQLIYIDTPGIKNKIENLQIKNIFKKYNNFQLVIFVTNKITWNDSDEILLNQIRKTCKPTILAINKVDLIRDKKKILPFISMLNIKYNFQEIIPISAYTGYNIDLLLKKIKNNLPVSKHDFSNFCETNVSQKFIISEIIREKFIRNLNQELPYIIKIKIIKFEFNKFKKYDIQAVIFVKNNQQKKIVIGKKGKKITYCYNLSKKEIEKFLFKKINLRFFIEKYH